jgi:hypothetical protein
MNIQQPTTRNLFVNFFATAPSSLYLYLALESKLIFKSFFQSGNIFVGQHSKGGRISEFLPNFCNTPELTATSMTRHETLLS